MKTALEFAISCNNRQKAYFRGDPNKLIAQVVSDVSQPALSLSSVQSILKPCGRSPESNVESASFHVGGTWAEMLVSL